MDCDSTKKPHKKFKSSLVYPDYINRLWRLLKDKSTFPIKSGIKISDPKLYIVADDSLHNVEAIQFLKISNL